MVKATLICKVTLNPLPFKILGLLIWFIFYTVSLLCLKEIVSRDFRSFLWSKSSLSGQNRGNKFRATVPLRYHYGRKTSTYVIEETTEVMPATD